MIGVRVVDADPFTEAQEGARRRAPLGAPVVEGMEGEDRGAEPEEARKGQQYPGTDRVHVNEIVVAAKCVEERDGGVGERLAVASAEGWKRDDPDAVDDT